MYKKNIVVLYSGGMGSFLAANAIRELSPQSSMTLYFNDTYLERIDLYRFLTDTVDFFWPGRGKAYLKAVLNNVPLITSGLTADGMKKRKLILSSWGRLMEANYPQFVYDADGRDLWEVFEDRKYIGNTRSDPCSEELKRSRSRRWIPAHFDKEDTDVAIGIDWSEKHRLNRAKKAWEFNIVAPLIDGGYDKEQYEQKIMRNIGFDRSSAYDIGLSHDNCGGFCVKAGLGHFKVLLKNDREKYLYHERKLEETIEKVGRYPFLRKNIAGKTEYITLREYREYIETGRLRINGELRICSESDNMADDLEVGGCGCAL